MTDRKLLEDVRDELKQFASANFFFRDDASDRVVSLGRWSNDEFPRFYADVRFTVEDFRSLSTTLARVEAALAETEEVKVEEPSFFFTCGPEAPIAKIVHGHPALARAVHHAMMCDEEMTEDVREMVAIAADPTHELWEDFGFPRRLHWTFEDGYMEVVQLDRAAIAAMGE